jgi:uncharacterized membrane protein YeaQ/YmgE (transglycosylase-associated protein family)
MSIVKISVLQKSARYSLVLGNFSNQLQTFTMADWIYVLIIGAIAGWLAGQLFRGYGFGIIGNIVVGIVGGFVGFWLLGKLGVPLGSGTISTILTSVIGAGVLLFIVGFFKK